MDHIYFTRWIENKSIGDSKLFSGGFLGLDNISVFNRSKAPLKNGFHLAQVFCLESLFVVLLICYVCI